MAAAPIRKLQKGQNGKKEEEGSCSVVVAVVDGVVDGRDDDDSGDCWLLHCFVRLRDIVAVAVVVDGGILLLQIGTAAVVDDDAVCC